MTFKPNTKRGDPFQPTNGTEGEYFRHNLCEKCNRDWYHIDTSKGCQILAGSLAGEQQKEWIIAEDGSFQGTCTAFQERNPHDEIRMLREYSKEQYAKYNKVCEQLIERVKGLEKENAKLQAKVLKYESGC